MDFNNLADRFTNMFLDPSFIDIDIVRILLFLLIFAVVFTAVGKTRIFREQKAIQVVITLVVSILSTWYLSESQILYSLVGYNILGILLITFIPLLIVLLFVHKANFGPKFRKTILILFGLVLAYVYFTKKYDFTASESKVTLLVGAVLIAAIIFDKGLHSFFRKKQQRER